MSYAPKHFRRKCFADQQWVGSHLNWTCYPIGYCATKQVKLITHLLYKQDNSPQKYTRGPLCVV